jgi:hypothetical protein
LDHKKNVDKALAEAKKNSARLGNTMVAVMLLGIVTGLHYWRVTLEKVAQKILQPHMKDIQATPLAREKWIYTIMASVSQLAK